MKTVIEMAREAGIVVTTDTPAQKENAQKVFERFAELVRADEREVCSKQINELKNQVKDWQHRHQMQMNTLPSTGIDANGYKYW